MGMITKATQSEMMHKPQLMDQPFNVLIQQDGAN